MRLSARSDLIVRRDYQASPASVGLARSLAARQAQQWSLPAGVTERLTLAMSELVTNAVRVSPRAQVVRVHLSLEHDPHTVRLAVWDACPRAPRAGLPALTLEAIDAIPVPDTGGLPSFGGWGLAVVEAMTDACGVRWEKPEGRAGKWVWTRFDL
jgi:anti-sigma regulatory factor (Ser/Thr protein kinase)